MLRSEQEIYIYETEEKPNRFAMMALLCCDVIIAICWLLDEIGIFRVRTADMRVGTAITFTACAVPLFMILFHKSAYSNPKTKYYIIAAVSIYTFTVGTLLTFHTTIMMMFPILIAMLYRSKQLGIIASAASLACTILSPVLGYLLGTWDAEFFKELILICTNGTAVIVGAYDGISLLNIGKILLYIVFPRIMMIGSCTLLMFYVIQIGVKHVENQLELFKLSRRDSLTGLFNQNCYNEVLESKKADRPAAVVFFDVNNLKLVNDAKGHEQGDLLLKRCAQSILNICDDVNTYAFRLGGDEFIIVALDAGESLVTEKISAWKAALEEINLENAADFEGLECSMAWGYSCGTLSHLDELVQLADKNMYAQKIEMKKSSARSANE